MEISEFGHNPIKLHREGHPPRNMKYHENISKFNLFKNGQLKKVNRKIKKHLPSV